MTGLRQQHPPSALLQVAGLASNAYYYPVKMAQIADRHATLKASIGKTDGYHQGRYGYRRITAALCQAGQHVNHKTVQKLMQVLGLRSVVRPKKYRSCRGQEGRVAPNLLARQFDADRPNQKWVTDVTKFRTEL